MTSITSKTAAATRLASGLSGFLTALWNTLTASAMEGEVSQRLRQDAGMEDQRAANTLPRDVSREMMRRSF